MTARFALEQGTLRGFRSGLAPIWLTLTEPPHASLDMPSLHARWKATVKRLRRSWGISEYAVSIEFQKRGAIHPHAILWAPHRLGDELASRKSRSSYRRRMHELRPMATSLGWGKMVDAVTIGYGVEGEGDSAPIEQVVRYASKDVSSYATKEAAANFKRAGAKRVRPVRLSRDFFPGGLTRAVELVKRQERHGPADPGPWERVSGISCGGR